jgi:hypothetical protein
MAADVDDSNIDLSDSSETISEHVRDSVHQPSFYMLPDLSDVLCSEDDDALSSEDHDPEHHNPCAICVRSADVRLMNACVIIAVNQDQHAHAVGAVHAQCIMLFLVIILMNQCPRQCS